MSPALQLIGPHTFWPITGPAARARTKPRQRCTTGVTMNSIIDLTSEPDTIDLTSEPEPKRRRIQEEDLHGLDTLPSPLIGMVSLFAGISATMNLRWVNWALFQKGRYALNQSRFLPRQGDYTPPGQRWWPPERRYFRSCDEQICCALCNVFLHKQRAFGFWDLPIDLYRIVCGECAQTKLLPGEQAVAELDEYPTSPEEIGMPTYHEVSEFWKKVVARNKPEGHVSDEYFPK